MENSFISSMHKLECSASRNSYTLWKVRLLFLITQVWTFSRVLFVMRQTKVRTISWEKYNLSKRTNLRFLFVLRIIVRIDIAIGLRKICSPKQNVSFKHGHRKNLRVRTKSVYHWQVLMPDLYMISENILSLIWKWLTGDC